MKQYKIELQEISYDHEEGFLVHYTVQDTKNQDIHIVCTCLGTNTTGIDNLKINFYNKDHKPINMKYQADFFNQLELLIYQDVSEEEEIIVENLYKSEGGAT